MAYVGGRRGELAEMADGIRRRSHNAREKARRTSPGPALVRFTAAVASGLALILALPMNLLASPAPLVAFVLAAGVGLAPRTRWVAMVLLLTVLVWLITTAVYDAPIDPLRLVGLTGSLYVAHTAAAFAAVLPYDAILSAVALGRWAARVGAVVGVSLALGLAGLAAADLLGGLASIVVPLIGISGGIGLVALMAWLYWRR